MKNHEVWDSYNFYTSEVTKHARYLGFAGMAICWVFRDADFSFPKSILVALFFIVLFFLADIAQYYISAIRLRSWMHKEESKYEADGKGLEQEYWPPKSLDMPTYRLFHIKLLLLLIGYSGIGIEIFSRAL